MQHSCCWLVIPGLCNEVSHDESQNGWQKTLAGISSTSCNTCLQICNFAALWLLAQPGWPFQGSAMRFCMAEARMDGKKTLAGTSCNKLLQICNLQHSCCWLAIPGLCNEVSHGRSQNGWQKTLAGISITSCNKLLQICNLQHAGCWLAIPGLCSEITHVRIQN